MVAIYACDVRPLKEKPLFDQLLPLVKESRQNEIQRNKSELDRCRSLAAGLLLRHGLKQWGIDYEDAAFTHAENGKPELAPSGEPGEVRVHFNLSHSGYYAVAAFAHQPIGIDIEIERLYWKQQNPPETHMGGINKPELPDQTGTSPEQKNWARLDRIARRTFTPEELAEYQSQKPEKKTAYFTRMWTRKESYLKATGQGLTQELSSVNTLEQGFYTMVEPSGLMMEETERTAYAMTYCTLAEPEPEYVFHPVKLCPRLGCNEPEGSEIGIGISEQAVLL